MIGAAMKQTTAASEEPDAPPGEHDRARGPPEAAVRSPRSSWRSARLDGAGRDRRLGDDAVDDVLDAGRAAHRDQPVRQHDRDERVDVVGEHEVAAVDGRARLGGADQLERGPRAGAESQVGVDAGRLARCRRRTARRLGRRRSPWQQRSWPGRPRSRRRTRGRRSGFSASRPCSMASSAVGVGVAHRDARHEAVALGLGQGVRALHLERVLRRDDGERARQHVRRAVDRDLPLLHRLEQRRLGLRARRG